jgi:hypothetical protein
MNNTLSNKLLLNKYNNKNDIIVNYNDYILDALVFNKNTHYISIFKDYMVFDYIEEFLKRYYCKDECLDRLPRISQYYKNYLKFFCHPIFKNFQINSIIQNYGDDKAEIYYVNNYGKSNNQQKGGNKEIFVKSKNIVNKKSNITKFNSKKKEHGRIFDCTVIDFINGKNEIKFIKETIKTEHSSIEMNIDNMFDSFSASKLRIIQTVEALKNNKGYYNTINTNFNNMKSTGRKSIDFLSGIKKESFNIVNSNNNAISKNKISIVSLYKPLIKCNINPKSRNNADILSYLSESKSITFTKKQGSIQKSNTISATIKKDDKIIKTTQPIQISNNQPIQSITNINLNTINIISPSVTVEEKLKLSNLLASNSTSKPNNTKILISNKISNKKTIPIDKHLKNTLILNKNLKTIQIVPNKIKNISNSSHIKSPKVNKEKIDLIQNIINKSRNLNSNLNKYSITINKNTIVFSSINNRNKTISHQFESIDVQEKTNIKDNSTKNKNVDSIINLKKFTSNTKGNIKINQLTGYLQKQKSNINSTTITNYSRNINLKAIDSIKSTNTLKINNNKTLQLNNTEKQKIKLVKLPVKVNITSATISTVALNLATKKLNNK